MNHHTPLHTRFLVGCEPHLPLTHINLCFETSPVFDPPGLEGLTCLTNRLLLEGTHDLTRQAFHEQVEGLGTEVVSATQSNWVSLGGMVLSAHRDRFLQLLKHAVTVPRLDALALERIRREMLSEIELLGDEDGYLARYWLKQVIFQQSPLGNHPLGRADSLRNITLDDVKLRHRETYSQGRLWVGLSTNASSDDAMKMCADWASDLPLGQPFMVDDLRADPISGRHVLLVDKPARTQAQLLVGHPAVQLSAAEQWHLQVAIDAFGGAFSSRLVQELRVKRGLSYDPYAYLSVEKLGGLFLMGASTDGTRLTEAIKVMLDEFEQLCSAGLSAAELQLARQARQNSFPFTIETTTLEVSQRLRGRLRGLRPGWIEDYLETLARASAAEIGDSVRAALRPNDVWIVAVCTVTDELAQACHDLPGVQTVRVVNHQDRS
ncbi:MAG: pitrilysin family protein [Myxococcota bacterium]|nr:pitrilysin family protein [Myxococcota bacterium]